MKIFQLVAILIFVVLVFLTLFYSIKVKTNTNTNTFDINDYYYEINHFSYNECLTPIIDETDLIKKVDEVFHTVFGDEVEKEKPYKVYYDDNRGAWLVHGTFQKNGLLDLFYSHKGGVAYIIIENSTGNVLALWHEE